jgi:hypothetical protein
VSGPFVTLDAATTKRLDEIRGSAPRRAPNVRVLAAFAQNTGCGLAMLGFAAEVDFDRLLDGTRFKAPFGQSPFAIARGRKFEERLRADDYAALRELLSELPGFPASGARVENLRTRDPISHRAELTRAQLARIVTGHPDAPHLLDGAVLETHIGGRLAYFEADALAARAAALHVAEIKSFARVDGRVDPDKLGAAIDQVAIYSLLSREAIARLGGDPDKFVSNEALLVTALNTGLRPVLSRKDISRQVARARQLLAAVPRAEDVAALVPASLSFAPVADKAAEEPKRLHALQVLAGAVGTHYTPDCLSSCGNARFCRERTFRSGSPCLLGTATARLIPGVDTLGRAEELTRGADPTTAAEENAAALLKRAGRLYDSEAIWPSE